LVIEIAGGVDIPHLKCKIRHEVKSTGEHVKVI